MKKVSLVFALGSLVLSSISFATECPSQWGNDDFNEKVSAAIKKATDCNDGVQIAYSCGMGNSNDPIIFSVAEQKCFNTFKKKKTEVALFQSIASRCEKKYSNAQGTMYRSFGAACRVEAAKIVANVNSPLE